MPWEKTFDTDVALTKAMEAFWSRGYEATSISDLVARMGINRGSLYDTFGDKRSLFMSALRAYGAVHLHDWTAALTRAHGPRGAILAAFERAVGAALEGGGRDGCLLINTALELSPHDKEVADFVGTCLADMEAFFRDRIEQAQAAGDIPGHVAPVETARALLGLFVAIRVFARSRPDEPLLRSLTDQAEALLQ
jgi:TetR/AcrR family transcriptional repressor of nem operon